MDGHDPSSFDPLLHDRGRLTVLARTQLLGEATRPSLDRFTRLAARVLRAPVSLISFLDDTHEHLYSHHGLALVDPGPRARRLASTYCQRVVVSGQPVAVADTRLDCLPEVEPTEVAGYLGVPIAIDGQTIGSLCVIDRQPREWSVEDVQTLSDLAESVVDLIRLRMEHREASAIQARLQTTLLSIGDGVITTDPAGMVSFLNPVAESLTGWTSAAAQGRSMAEVFRTKHESTDAVVQDPVLQVLEPGGIAGLANQTTLIARDGTERSIDDSAAPIRSGDGTFLGCILVFRDITARRDQEQQLEEARALLDSILKVGEVGTWSYDLARDVVVVDENLAAIYGIPPHQPRSGPVAYFLEMIDPTDHAEIMRQVERAIESGESYEVEYRVVRPDATVRWVVSRGRVSRNEEGKAVRLPGVVIDITEQKRTQQELHDARTRLDYSLSVGSVATWTWDLTNDRIVADKNLERLFSVTPEEANGGSRESYLRAIHPDDVGRVVAAFERATALDNIYDVEYRVMQPDGSARFVIARGTVERDAEGRAVSLPGVVIDTTDRRRAEESIRQSESFQRLIFESVRDFSIFTTDLAGRITTWNAGAENVFGYTEAEAVGQPAALVFTPEDRAARIPEQEMAAAAEHGRDTDERWHLRKDGSRFFASGMVRPITDLAGSLIGFTKVARDVTAAKLAADALQQSEERFRDLFGSIDEGFCILQVRFDADQQPVDYRFTEANPAFERITQLVEPIGKWASEVLPGLDHAWHERYGRISLSGVPERFEMREDSMDGRTFACYALRTGRPEDHKVAVLFNDITLRRRAEDQRQQLISQLTDADRRKDEFLAMLAHELRNPLGAISSGIRLLRSSREPEAFDQVRDMIDRQTRHLTHLIDDLLDVSRVATGKIVLRRQTVDLSQTIARAIDQVRPVIEEKRHTLTIKQSEGAIRFVADPTRCEQILGNLLTNAAKYTPAGGTIHLDAHSDGSQIVFAVTDNGVGISAEMLPKVFGLFTQIDSSIDRSQGGLGIGLTLVRNLVEMHGGSVSATSDGPGQGSTFTVAIPIGEPTASTTAPAVPVPIHPTDAQRRILIVDDNRDTARMTARLLAHGGNKTLTAHDGYEGIEAARAFQPNVVLLDIGLPGMNGYEVARALRDDDALRNAVIVAVSGYGEGAARDRSREAGFDHHLTKPLDFDLLDEILRGRSAGA